MEQQTFNRKNIEAIEGVSIVDQDEVSGLELFCYDTCTNKDSPLRKQCRGVVFHNETLVMKAFPYNTEYNHMELESIQQQFTQENINIETCHVFDSYEGSLIRMFWFNEKWYISTHRKLDAFKSKWSSSESFGTLFEHALESECQYNDALMNSLPVDEDKSLVERFQTTLDVQKQYMFLVGNTDENRIVCHVPPQPFVYHVGTFDCNGINQGVNQEVLSLSVNVNLPHPPSHTEFKTVQELCNYVNTVDYMDQQGVIVFTPNNSQIKIVNYQYQELFNARGNEPSVKFRYLQERMNRTRVEMLEFLYPKMIETFEKYENTLYDVAITIYDAYVNRFIKKQYVILPREEFGILKLCHTWHLENRAEHKISREKVIEILNMQLPTRLNRMVRRSISEKIKAENGEQTEEEGDGDEMANNKNIRIKVRPTNYSTSLLREHHQPAPSLAPPVLTPPVLEQAV